MHIEPATVTDKVASCVVLDEGEDPSVMDVAVEAGNAKAIIFDEDEAGDDQFVVRFHGEEQGLYDQDKLTSRIRDLHDKHRVY